MRLGYPLLDINPVFPGLREIIIIIIIIIVIIIVVVIVIIITIIWYNITTHYVVRKIP